MPRLSVYVPDELLDRVRALDESENTSQLVQRGLQRLLDDESGPPPAYASPPRLALYSIVALRKKLADEARREYQIGFTAAIEAAGGLPLAVLDRLADLNFDVGRWLKEYRKAAADELYRSGQFIRPEKHLPREEFEQLMRDRDSGKYGRLPDPPPAESSLGWVWRLARVLGELADPVGFDEASFMPTKARLRGFSDATRALWLAIEDPSQEWLAGSDDKREEREGGEISRTGTADDS